MKKILLAILGFYPATVLKDNNGKMIWMSKNTLADRLKENYYRYADRHHCFCGGKIESSFHVFPPSIAAQSVMQCKCCEKIYPLI